MFKISPKKYPKKKYWKNFALDQHDITHSEDVYSRIPSCMHAISQG